MISVITGAVIGMTTGIIAGEGMEVVKNSEGKRRIKKIDLKKGMRGAGDELILAATTGLLILGTMIVADAVKECEQEKLEEKKEYYDGKKDELIERTDTIVDALADNKFKEQSKYYLGAAHIARNYNGDLTDIVIKSNDGGLVLNKFESHGIACMTDEEINKVLLENIKKEKELIRDTAVDAIKYGEWWEIEEIEEAYDVLEKELF